ncbi:hypothetical protein tpqmel_0301 [Candidatus Gastranaerophilus sp. (ex Termes propinquus)]|nr:hypothetical protein tpqmel_0301 [Candidatus Gastranaerophilus sp. (ex Termes propinquus)]
MISFDGFKKKSYDASLQEKAPQKPVDKKGAIEWIFQEKKIFEGSENIIITKALPAFENFERKKVVILLSAVAMVTVLALLGIVNKVTSPGAISDVTNQPAIYGQGHDAEHHYEELGLHNIPKNDYATGTIDYELLNLANNETIVANISKVSWEVPENIANKNAYKKFLQMVGKNIKLNLQNDLLLTNDYAKNNTIKVDIKISGNGNIESIKIKDGSGSSSIDGIIKKSVGETLSYMKPPGTGLINKGVEVTLVISL